MNVTSKFNIKDSVFVIYDNKIQLYNVTSISIFIHNDIGNGVISCKIQYRLSIFGYVLSDILENRLFKTKEELIQSL